jgi:GxxExxY protein
METELIKQIATKIMHDLGAGYSESIYKNAMHRKLAVIDCTCIMEKNIPVLYDGEVIGVCRADIVTACHVIEIKAVRKMPIGVEKQVCKYVKHLVDLDGKKARYGLVINFNQESEKIETIEPHILLKPPVEASEEEEGGDITTTIKRRKFTPVE